MTPWNWRPSSASRTKLSNSCLACSRVDSSSQRNAPGKHTILEGNVSCAMLLFVCYMTAQRANHLLGLRQLAPVSTTRGLKLFTWTRRNSFACRTSAALAGSMWRSAATEMAVPSTSVTGSLARPCTPETQVPRSEVASPLVRTLDELNLLVDMGRSH